MILWFPATAVEAKLSTIKAIWFSYSPRQQQVSFSKFSRLLVSSSGGFKCIIRKSYSGDLNVAVRCFWLQRMIAKLKTSLLFPS